MSEYAEQAHPNQRDRSGNVWAPEDPRQVPNRPVVEQAHRLDKTLSELEIAIETLITRLGPVRNQMSIKGGSATDSTELRADGSEHTMHLRDLCGRMERVIRQVETLSSELEV